MPISIALESDVAGAEVDKIGAGAAHDRLVIIVAERIVVRDEFETRRFAPAHIMEQSRAYACIPPPNDIIVSREEQRGGNSSITESLRNGQRSRQRAARAFLVRCVG